MFITKYASFVVRYYLLYRNKLYTTSSFPVVKMKEWQVVVVVQGSLFYYTSELLRTTFHSQWQGWLLGILCLYCCAYLLLLLLFKEFPPPTSLVPLLQNFLCIYKMCHQHEKVSTIKIDKNQHLALDTFKSIHLWVAFYTLQHLF